MAKVTFREMTQNESVNDIHSLGKIFQESSEWEIAKVVMLFFFCGEVFHLFRF